MSPPQETTDGGSPMPRKDRVASATMKTPRETVAVTMIGAAELGMMCRIKVRIGETPSALEAVTKSEFFTLITVPRVIRAICGQPKTARTDTTVMITRHFWNTCMITIQSRSYRL